MTRTRGKYLFIVQGEGRGHLTQAIALQNMLTESGAAICEVMVGKSENRSLPGFFYTQAKAPVTLFESPNFVMDSKSKSIRIMPSVVKNLMKLPTFVRSLNRIHEKIREHQPDIIVNFYDPLAGLYNLLYHPRIPLVCIAHQYIYHHPGFEFPKGSSMNKTALKLYTWLTSIGAARKFALSFYPINDNYKRSIIGTPPLLRKELFRQEITDGHYLLIYLVNKGYTEDIIRWHLENPQVELHCFTDNKEVKDEYRYDDTLYFHALDDKKFLEKMAGAKALVSTAGFESVCEALYLGKPVMMVPVEGHFEQFCNARDARKAGAGIYNDTFDISKLLAYLPGYKVNRSFRYWVENERTRIADELAGMLAVRTEGMTEPAMA